MLLFVGLGNPGAKYAHNRHNIGFMAVDEIARRHGFAPWRRRFQGETSEGTLDHEKVVLLRPTTFMNESGRAVQEAANFFKLAAGEIIVFQDELELPPAKVARQGRRRHRRPQRAAFDLRAYRQRLSPRAARDRSPRHQGTGARPRAVGFRQERPALGRGAVRGGCRQCRPARERQGFDVPEQGASGDAGQGIFRQGRCGGAA